MVSTMPHPAALRSPGLPPSPPASGAATYLSRSTWHTPESSSLSGRQAARFTIEQGIRNRGVTCNRYIVEVLFARNALWRFLGGEIKYDDFHLLNDVWWWALGFQNLVCRPLKPPAK